MKLTSKCADIKYSRIRKCVSKIVHTRPQNSGAFIPKQPGHPRKEGGTNTKDGAKTRTIVASKTDPLNDVLQLLRDIVWDACFRSKTWSRFRAIFEAAYLNVG